MTARVGRCMAGAAAGLALTASLAGCKTDDGGSKGDGGKSAGGVHLTAAQEALSKASKKTGDVKSFRATMSISTTVSGQETQMKGDLAFRLQPKVAMKFTVPTIKAGDRALKGFEEIVVDDSAYMKMPAITQRVGKPWVGFSLSKLGETTGLDVKSLEEGRRADPSLNAKMLTASKDVKEVGKETIGGVSTTHYKGTFRVADAMAKLGEEERSQTQKAYQDAGVDKLTFDLWIDGKQLPRRISMTTPPDAHSLLDMTMNYTAFNVPVSIKAPPKSQVADGAKLSRARRGDGGTNVPG